MDNAFLLDINISKDEPEAYIVSKKTRVFVFLLDCLGFSAFAAGVWFFIAYIFRIVLYEPGDGLSISASIFYVLYYYILESSSGKTLGKKIMKCKVVTHEGFKPNAVTILARTLCRFIPLEGFTFLGKNGSGWHDRLPKCYVVKDSYSTKF